jgi:hypothetical protein
MFMSKPRVLIMIIASNFVACKSEIKVDGQNIQNTTIKSPAVRTSKGEPIEVKDAVVGDRVYFQTRTPIVLNIRDTLLSSGQTFSLINKTMTQTLIKDQAFGIAEPFFGLSDLHQTALETYQKTLTLYPLDNELTGKLTVGPQTLQVLVDDGGDGKYADYNITRKDYSVFAVGSTAFPTAVSRVGGFEVQSSEYVQSVLTNGKHTMSLGLTDMFSR